MKKTINIFYLFVAFLGNTSCSDIFESSIKDKSVVILAPGDNLVSESYTQTFWWDPVDEAISYNLQIVSPDFTNVATLTLDTNVLTNKFTYTLRPGTYQWRIRAQNGSSHTAYFTRTITIDTASLAFQVLTLSSPANFTYVNSSTINFSWQSLFGTEDYKLEVDTITGNFFGTLPLDQLTPYTSFSYNLNKEGSFIWRVKATNSTEESPYSSTRNFIIDKTKPTAVTLSSPISGGSYSRPITLTWEPSSSADVNMYKVYAYDVVSTDTTILSTFPKEISSTSFSFTSGAINQKIVWRVTAVDFAGNESDFSSYRNFFIGL